MNNAPASWTSWSVVTESAKSPLWLRLSERLGPSKRLSFSPNPKAATPQTPSPHSKSSRQFVAAKPLIFRHFRRAAAFVSIFKTLARDIAEEEPEPSPESCSGSNRYPTSRIVLMNRGCSGSGSILLRSVLMQRSTLRSVTIKSSPQTPLRILSRGRARPEFLAKKSRSRNSLGVRETSAPRGSGKARTWNDVIVFYSEGGQPKPNPDRDIRPLNFTIEEKADLMAFLKSLSEELRQRQDSSSDPASLTE